MKDDKKIRDLVLGVIFDIVGYLSYAIPMLGEFSDLVWAPISGVLMAYMYKGTKGKIAGVFSFLEEVMPFSDFIPSFTLMWIYTYLLQNRDAKAKIES